MVCHYFFPQLIPNSTWLIYIIVYILYIYIYTKQCIKYFSMSKWLSKLGEGFFVCVWGCVCVCFVFVLFCLFVCFCLFIVFLTPCIWIRLCHFLFLKKLSTLKKAHWRIILIFISESQCCFCRVTEKHQNFVYMICSYKTKNIHIYLFIFFLKYFFWNIFY